MNKDDKAAREAEIRRGELARRIIESEIWTNAYERLQRGMLERLLSRGTTNLDTLELKRKICALRDVKANIEELMITGKLAEQQIEADSNGRK